MNEKIYEPIIDNTYSQNNNKDNKKDNINERDMIEDKNKNIKINNNEIPNDKKKKGNVVTIKYNKDRTKQKSEVEKYICYRLDEKFRLCYR